MVRDFVTIRMLRIKNGVVKKMQIIRTDKHLRFVGKCIRSYLSTITITNNIYIYLHTRL